MIDRVCFRENRIDVANFRSTNQVTLRLLENRERTCKELGICDPVFIDQPHPAQPKRLASLSGARTDIDHPPFRSNYRSQLSRAPRVVEYNYIRIVVLDDTFELFDLAFAKIRGDIGRFAPLGHAADNAGPRRFGQAGDLVERVIADGLTRKNNANEDCFLARYAVDAFGFVQVVFYGPGVL